MKIYQRFNLRFLLLCLSGLLGCMIGCTSLKSYDTIPFKKLPLPPGTVRIAPNLFFDRSEMTNIGYREFLVWHKNIYGKNSDEYKRLLPKNDVWKNLHPGYWALDTSYYCTFDFDDYPAVGISFEQATIYSKWRSDRVMQMLLCQRSIIPYSNTLNKDSIFTIEKYFTGNYLGIKPDPRLPYYPEYSLPDSSTFRQVLAYDDSVRTKKNTWRYKSGCCLELLTEIHCLQNITPHSVDQPFGIIPTKISYCQECKPIHFIHHLQGNVREMTSTENSIFGRSFLHACSTPVDLYTNDSNYINAYTGFRNVCQYKRWDSTIRR